MENNKVTQKQTNEKTTSFVFIIPSIWQIFEAFFWIKHKPFTSEEWHVTLLSRLIVYDDFKHHFNNKFICTKLVYELKCGGISKQKFLMKKYADPSFQVIILVLIRTNFLKMLIM